VDTAATSQIVMNTIQQARMISVADEYACIQAIIHLKIFVSIAADSWLPFEAYGCLCFASSFPDELD